MESRFWPGEHNEADLESKKIDSILLLKGTPPSTTNEFIEWSSWIVAASFPEVEGKGLVPDLCGNGHRDPDGVVRRTIWDFHFR